MHNRQSGNAIVFILLGIALFAALAHTFMRGSQTGQGNLTAHQSQLAAQELASFFNNINQGFQKLRQRGCSETDISFANTVDTDVATISINSPASAPTDKSCNIFDPAGAGINYSINPADYQVSPDIIPAGEHKGQMQFRFASASTIGVGTSENDLMVHFNYIRPDICKAYNRIQNINIDYTVFDSGAIVGDENTGYVGLDTFCRYNEGQPQGQIRYVWVAH